MILGLGSRPQNPPSARVSVVHEFRSRCLFGAALRARLWTCLRARWSRFARSRLPAARAASVQPLEIVTKTGVQVFSVEMATTEEEKETGLMYRKELRGREGHAVRLLAASRKCRCG